MNTFTSSGFGGIIALSSSPDFLVLMGRFSCAFLASTALTADLSCLA
jgi:hypothetical protein